MLSKHFSQIERFKIIGTKIGADNSLGATKSVYNHMLMTLSVHKWEHTHTHTHTHKHTHTIKVIKKCYSWILQGGHKWIGIIFFKKIFWVIYSKKWKMKECAKNERIHENCKD